MKLLSVIAFHAIFGSSMAMLRKRGLQLVGEVTKLRLIDAETNVPIAEFDPLVDGDEIYLNGAASDFNIEAIANGSVESVKFGLDGDSSYRVENVAPYSLCGDSGNNFKTCNSLGPGSHTVSATPFSSNGANGNAGSTVTINFTIYAGSQTSPTTKSPTTSPTMTPTNAPITQAPTKTPTTTSPITAPTSTPPTTMSPTKTPTKTPTNAPATAVPTSQLVGQVTELRLIDAESHLAVEEFDPLVDGDEIYLNGAVSNFNIEAITTGLVESVKFGLNGNSNYRVEGAAAWALCGNSGSNFNTCDSLGPGTHTVSATPYSENGASGFEGGTVSVTFTIYSGSQPTPTTPSPTTFTPAPSTSPITSQPVATPPPGTEWVVVDANAPIEPRHEACFVMVNNPVIGKRAYLVGGRGNKRVDAYDPVNKSWSVVTSPPQQLHHMQCVAAQGKLYILGAWTGGFPEEQNAKQWVYDPATDVWTELAQMHPERARGSAAVIVSSDETKIYVSHGNNGGHEKGDFAVSLPYLDEYDITTNSWTEISSNAPNPRDHTGGALVNGRICVSGGRNGGELDWPDVAPTDCYDLSTGEWSEEADIPNPRAGSAYGTSCDGKLIVAAGEGSRKVWDEVEVFDGESWSALPSLNLARHGTGLAIDCDTYPYEIHIASGSSTPRSGDEEQHHERLFVY